MADSDKDTLCKDGEDTFVKDLEVNQVKDLVIEYADGKVNIIFDGKPLGPKACFEANKFRGIKLLALADDQFTQLKGAFFSMTNKDIIK